MFVGSAHVVLCRAQEVRAGRQSDRDCLSIVHEIAEAGPHLEVGAGVVVRGLPEHEVVLVEHVARSHERDLDENVGEDLDLLRVLEVRVRVQRKLEMRRRADGRRLRRLRRRRRLRRLQRW